MQQIAKLATIVAICLGVFATPAQAQWYQVENRDGCSAERTYEDGVQLTMWVRKDVERASLSLWSHQWSSIVQDRTYPMRLEFEGGLKFDVSATGMVVSQTDENSASYGTLMYFRDMIVVGALSQASHVTIWRGENLVGRFSLSGSRAALEDIARCAGRMQARVARDPFAE